MWAVVLAIGVPSMWRNVTATALVFAWLAAEAYYLVTGNNLPVEYYVYPDIAVIAVIMCKQGYRRQDCYDSAWHQLKCLVLERSPADRVVMLIFPVMWVLYLAEMPAFHKWYALWLLAITQFLAAGWEGYFRFRRDKAVSDTPDNPSGDEFRRFIWVRGYG